MKAIKIDVENQKIVFVEVSSDYKDIQVQLGLGCDIITAPIILENEDTVYLDDEGLLRGPAKCGWTMSLSDGTFWKFVGNGLILGAGDEGESADVKSTIEEITTMVGWMDETAAKLYQHENGF